MLHKTQINQLFDFVKSKYVRHYDLQLELVDHLATSIESEMKADQSITFQMALQKTYAQWPVTGFNQFIQEKKKGLSRYWRNRFWNYLKTYFELPRILLTILLALIFFFSAQVNFQLFHLDFNLLYLFLIVLGCKAYYESFDPHIEYPIYGKEGLLTHEVFWQQIGFILLIPSLMLYVLLQEPTSISETISTMPLIGGFFSLLLAFTVIVIHAKNTVFMNWMHQEIEDKYPEFIGMMSTLKTK